MSEVLGMFGHWISPCYGPFLLGACFEAYEPLYFFNFQIFPRGLWSTPDI
jgi:hypothetical protein